MHAHYLPHRCACVHAFAIPVITALQTGFSPYVGRMELVSGTGYLWVGLQRKRETRHYTAVLELQLFVEERDEVVKYVTHRRAGHSGSRDLQITH